MRKNDGPYVMPDGTKIAENWKDLTDLSILSPLHVDPSGNSVGYSYVWTATNSDGSTGQAFVTCQGWKADPAGNFNGMGARTNRKDSLWSNRIGRISCSRKHRLFCFQQ
jgi:hypothetical protein